MSAAGPRFAESERGAARDRLASRAAVTVMKAGSVLSRAIERALSDADLTLPQFNVLMELAASPTGTLPMYAVTDRLVSTPPSMSWLANRMRDRGLITKRRDDDDERVVLVTITETGWETLGRAMPRAFAIEKQLWRNHQRADLQAIVALLEPLIE